MGVFGAALLIALLRFAAAQDANCDFTQYTQIGNTYYITNPRYSQNYSGPLQCRWMAIAPTGYQNVLNCPLIELPASQGCSMDRLMISRTGDPQLSGADVYCGRGTTTAVSNGRQLVLALIAANNSPGGRFYCELTVRAATTNPTCSCGYKKRNRIVGGQETAVNEYPMMGGLVETAIVQVKCGVTIIEKRYVVTAAHCVVNRALSEFIVVVGEHDVTTGDSPATQGINIERITIHPQYNPLWCQYTKRAYNALRVQYNNAFRMLLGLPRRCSASGMFAEARADGFPAIMRKKAASLLHRVRGSRNTILSTFANRSNYDNDIALLRLRQDIQFSDLVGPACLPFKYASTDLTGSYVTLLGWGTLFIGGPTSNVLRKVDVQMISQNSCRQQIPSLTDRQICTYTPGKDACQDDSGGPGLYTDPSTGRLHLMLVVSYGRSCASGSPGVNARVPALLQWIQANTPDANYCRA